MPERSLAEILSSRTFKVADKKEQLAIIDAEKDTARAEFNKKYSDKWIRAAGFRYKDCEFENYECTDKRQTDAIKLLKEYAAGEPTRNVIFLGPTGTGKDHLAVGLLRRFTRRLIGCGYVSGPQLFADVADAWRREGGSDLAIHKEYSVPRVLCISDPSLPGGLSDANVKFLYRLIDERYRACRATVVTLNAKDGDNAAELLGVQAWSRLIEGAIKIGCNWGDYRREGRKEK
ncbi:MAG: ATP-binding protein [FCB group bacterium]|nr:ATP-binding protein [FCB group bacterium]